MVGRSADRRVDATSRASAGLTQCTPEEFATLQRLNAAYNAKFGFPFMLAVRGPRGDRPVRRRRSSPPSRAAWRTIPTSSSPRPAQRPPRRRAAPRRPLRRTAGARQAGLGLRRAAGAALRPGLRRERPAHRHLPHRRAPRLRGAARALDARSAASTRSTIDAVGNVVGVYRDRRRRREREDACSPARHYDTVRNGGKYDGRLGIFVPMVCVRELQPRRPAPAVRARGRRLRRGGRAALQGDLPRLGRAGRPVRSALARPGRRRRHHDARRDAPRRAAGEPARDRRSSSATRRATSASSRCTSSRARCSTSSDLPLGVVTSINGGVRFAGEVRGMASHAGTTPMDSRRDAAAAVAELALYLEKRAAASAEPGRHDGHARGAERLDQRRARPLPVHARHPRHHRPGARRLRRTTCSRELHAICERRGVSYSSRRRCASPRRRSAPEWQPRWERAVDAPACRCTACRAAPATTR